MSDSHSTSPTPSPGPSRSLSQPEVLEANAKLTLSLRITGVRDDGYHLISAEMVSLDLCDRIEIREGADGFTVVRDGVATAGTEDDLVQRALRLAGRRAEVLLHKNIPAGAGLGGGSSDAAAVLRWAGIEDPLLAASLGADVAFCLTGGRARVTGIGEFIEVLDPIDRTFTLMTPPLHCSTPVVYRMWDQMGGPVGDHGNDLEPAALAAYPELLPWRDKMAQAVGSRPRLAGSGSTWFVEGAFPGTGRVVTRSIVARS